jgi:hypothetical protein
MSLVSLAPLREPPLGGFGGLVGIDLVADQQQRLRPVGLVERRHPFRVGGQGVRAERVVLVGFAAGAEHQPDRIVLCGQCADPAGREGGVGSRPHRLAVEPHVIRSAGAWSQVGEHDQCVVVAGHLEGVCCRAQNLDRARTVGLHPDRRRVFVDVPE